MRGEWNGLQSKFIEECPFAFYAHCFAHQLQLALVAASKEVNKLIFLKMWLSGIHLSICN
jgi:hypothetical protein